MPRIIIEEVGRVPGAPDVKLETGYIDGPLGTRLPYPRVFHRDVTHVFELSVKVPDSGDFVPVIRECILAGLAAGGVAAFLSSPASAIPAFKTAFWGTLVIKLGEQATEFEWIGINEHQSRGEWSPI
ncbi:hypothetical protein [Thiothrix winogradskyi]|uniref:Uncharacterized protein n=1 Tax=Thiothrix winogradskyi TaxID=96472 RepID=A0ABY3T1J6_9GAMM|nr:hypothetical protein [Thiothrix winogradskyi]UJS25278.1 hypothetical protein L2Y54_04355 [Thiothrix winogradskyi]